MADEDEEADLAQAADEEEKKDPETSESDNKEEEKAAGNDEELVAIPKKATGAGCPAGECVDKMVDELDIKRATAALAFDEARLEKAQKNLNKHSLLCSDGTAKNAKKIARDKIKEEKKKVEAVEDVEKVVVKKEEEAKVKVEEAEEKVNEATTPEEKKKAK